MRNGAWGAGHFGPSHASCLLVTPRSAACAFAPSHAPEPFPAEPFPAESVCSDVGAARLREMDSIVAASCALRDVRILACFAHASRSEAPCAWGRVGVEGWRM